MKKLSIISTSTFVKGTLTSKNDLRFEGRLEGNLKNEGRLVLAKESRVIGYCEAQNCKADGQLFGNMHIKHRLHVGHHALLEASIQTQELCADPGGRINGEIKMIL